MTIFDLSSKAPYIAGPPGLSAYQVALSQGFVGSESAWLASLVGAAGDPGIPGSPGAPGATGAAGPRGLTGATGLSAYQVAQANGFVGTESAWLASLVGTPGTTGATGPAGPAGTSGLPSGGTVGQYLRNTAPATGAWTQIGASEVWFTEGTIARNVAAKFLDFMPSVADYGAAPSNWQTLINTLPDVSAVYNVLVPAGTYAGNFSGLSVGSRKMVWHLQGGVVFSSVTNTSAGTFNRDILPPGTVVGVDYEAAVYPTTEGPYSWGTDRTSVYAAPYNFLRTTTHTGGYAGTAVGINLNVTTAVSSSTGNHEFGLNVSLNETAAQTSVTAGDGSQPQFCAVISNYTRQATAVGTLASGWGINALSKDLTNRKSSISGGELWGAEVNIAAGGPDDFELRRAYDAIITHPFELQGTPSPDGISTVAIGYRCVAASNLTSQLTPMLISYGYVAEGLGNTGMNAGGINVGFAANGAKFVGFQVNGPPPGIAAIQVSVSGGAGTMRLGSDVKAATGEVGNIFFDGQRSNGTPVAYAEIASTVVTNTSTFDGSLNIRTAVGGSMTDALVFVGNQPFMRFGASGIFAITLGAPDSAGSGYRVLRVPNT